MAFKSVTWTADRALPVLQRLAPSIRWRTINNVRMLGVHKHADIVTTIELRADEFKIWSAILSQGGEYQALVDSRNPIVALRSALTVLKEKREAQLVATNNALALLPSDLSGIEDA